MVTTDFWSTTTDFCPFTTEKRSITTENESSMTDFGHRRLIFGGCPLRKHHISSGLLENRPLRPGAWQVQAISRVSGRSGPDWRRWCPSRARRVPPLVSRCCKRRGRPAARRCLRCARCLPALRRILGCVAGFPAGRRAARGRGRVPPSPRRTGSVRDGRSFRH